MACLLLVKTNSSVTGDKACTQEELGIIRQVKKPKQNKPPKQPIAEKVTGPNGKATFII